MVLGSIPIEFFRILLEIKEFLAFVKNAFVRLEAFPRQGLNRTEVVTRP